MSGFVTDNNLKDQVVERKEEERVEQVQRHHRELLTARRSRATEVCLHDLAVGEGQNEDRRHSNCQAKDNQGIGYSALEGDSFEAVLEMNNALELVVLL